MRSSAGELDRACVEELPHFLSVDAGERLQRMERHAAAMQAMFGAMAKAYVAIAPNLTTAQRDILSRNIVPSPPFPVPFPPPPLGPGFSSHPGGLAVNCGPGEPRPAWMGVALGHPAALISEIAIVLVRPESAQ